MTLEEREILPPLWLAHPETGRYSPFWKTERGVNCLDAFQYWYTCLSQSEQEEYRRLFPEPVTWKGYWEQKDEARYFQQDGFSVRFWNENGTPRYTLSQVQKERLSGKKKPYFFFWGHKPSRNGDVTKSCLSQWWQSDFQSESGVSYCCMEQYMMAGKAERFGDEEIRRQILACREPRKIKMLGRKIKNFDEEAWNKVKYSIVLNGNYLKFTQSPELKRFLLSTQNAVLVEASPYDAVWGIKLAETDRNIQNPRKWRGANLLGFALMEVRDEIRRTCANETLCSSSKIEK